MCAYHHDPIPKPPPPIKIRKGWERSIIGRRGLTKIRRAKVKPHTHLAVSTFSLPSSPWQPLISFLSLCTCLFWAFHINRIESYKWPFCVQFLSLSLMFSGFILVVTCINISFLFNTATKIGVQVFVSFLLGIYLGGRLLGRMVILL